MKKMLCIPLLVVMLILTACQNTSDAPLLEGTVSIFTEDAVILSEEVSLQAENVEEALVKTCQQNKIPYTLTNNMFDNFGGIASTQTDGWILYVNGELAQAGAKFITLEDGFLIEFKYVNYDEVF
ncbi:MAG: DUF4430 domain-containing protein [Clostridia bacterium]|nr:DUF4430 domain-containing protein [Clostridia bacterium]